MGLYKKIPLLFFLVLFLYQVSSINIGYNDDSIPSVQIPLPTTITFNNNTGSTNNSVYAEIWQTIEGNMDNVIDLFPTFITNGFNKTINIFNQDLNKTNAVNFFEVNVTGDLKSGDDVIVGDDVLINSPLADIIFSGSGNNQVITSNTDGITLELDSGSELANFNFEATSFLFSDAGKIGTSGTITLIDDPILLLGSDYIAFGDLANVQLRYDSGFGEYNGITQAQHFIVADVNDFQDVDRQPATITGANPIISYSADATDANDYIRIYADVSDSSYIDFGLGNLLYIGGKDQKNVTIDHNGTILSKGQVCDKNGCIGAGGTTNLFFMTDQTSRTIPITPTTIYLRLSNDLVSDSYYSISNDNENVTITQSGLYKITSSALGQLTDTLGGIRAGWNLSVQENSTGAFVSIPYSISASYVREGEHQMYSSERTFLYQVTAPNTFRVSINLDPTGTTNVNLIPNGSSLEMEFIR